MENGVGWVIQGETEWSPPKCGCGDIGGEAVGSTRPAATGSVAGVAGPKVPPKAPLT